MAWNAEANAPDGAAWMRALAGRFIVFDGPDGSGKSTQFARFAAHARAAGVNVVEVREPGGTPIGEKIRGILLDPENAEMTLRAEMLLYMASRAQLFEERIKPALAAGSMVLAERSGRSRLVDLLAIEGDYPLYGAVWTDPPGAFARFGEVPRGAFVDTSLIDVS